ncbi:hypothetical protein OPT61_g701 [Boeremia exigua]|uniref:Uncharacterized protein n=1 Tax=Boeremia exigua TaxID=749465 RepID=A0ACC2ISR0_9PLEO|nr:hypothetical protein OPT61_g701 [Boeremia exigua]
MSESNKPKVAFLGPEASYTHQATLDTFSSDQYTLAPQTTIEDVFAAVQDGTVKRGVVPFENSTNGSVVFTLDLFANLQGKFSDVLVCGEAYVGVSHCLLGLDSPTSTDYSKITKLYSHPQAWGQCKTFLQQHLKHAERFDVSSTSRAAQMVANSNDSSAAAISSKVAGTLFKLSLLVEGINDVSGNQTRFLVLRRKDSPQTLTQSSAASAGHAVGDSNDEEDYKSLLLFTLPYTPSNPNPGALAQCLSVFGRHKLNLTSINTRPSGVANWEYIFFIEFKGRKDEGEGGAVNEAFKELDGCILLTSIFIPIMPPRKRQHNISPRFTRSKSPNISKSPQPSSPSPPPVASSSSRQIPEVFQPMDQAHSTRHISSLSELSTTATSRQTISNPWDEHTTTLQADAIDGLSTSDPFTDWLEANIGSYEEKRSSEPLQFMGSGSEAAVGDMARPSDTHLEGADLSDSGPEDASLGSDQADSKSTTANVEADDEREQSPKSPSRTKKRPRKDEGKKGKGKAARGSRQPGKNRSRLSAEDAELAKAVDRIHANVALTRGLLFRVAQKLPEARKIVLETDESVQKSRKDSIISQQDSTLADTFNEAENFEVQEGMPSDQPNEHPIGTDRPAHFPTSIVDMRDRATFNENILQPPMQRAEQAGDFITPSTTDMNNIGWHCGRCAYWNQPVHEPSEKVHKGGVSGVVQKYQCEKCAKWLIEGREMRYAAKHVEEKEAEREVELAVHPKAVPIPGKEPSKKSMTDVLAGGQFRAVLAALRTCCLKMLSRGLGRPAVPRHPPHNQAAIADHPAQRRPHPIIAKVHVVEIQVLSVAPDLLEFDLVATGRVLVGFEGVGRAWGNEIDRGKLLVLAVQQPGRRAVRLPPKGVRDDLGALCDDPGRGPGLSEREIVGELDRGEDEGYGGEEEARFLVGEDA